MTQCRMERGVYVVALAPEGAGAGGKEDIEGFVKSAVESLPAGARAILVDMEGVRMLRSSGLGALLSACEQLKIRGLRMGVCRIPAFGRNLFKISGLDQLLLVFGDVEEGLDALGWGDAEAAAASGDPSPR